MPFYASPDLTWPIGTRDDDMQTDGRWGPLGTTRETPLSIQTFDANPAPVIAGTGDSNYSYPVGG